MSMLSKLPKLIKNKAKRLGRGLGSGSGAKSGRGTTRHQKARENIPLHFEGGQAKMSKKFPLLRGKSRNKSIRLKPLVIGLNDLNKLKNGEIVTTDVLIKYKLIDKKAKKFGVKILGNGKLERKLTVKITTSQSARKMIEKLGGKVETL